MLYHLSIQGAIRNLVQIPKILSNTPATDSAHVPFVEPTVHPATIDAAVFAHAVHSGVLLL